MSKSTYRWLILGVVLALFVLGIVVYAILYRPTPVPDVLMVTVSEAEGRLGAVGLELGVASKVATRVAGPGLVFGQSPAAGTSVRRRSSVDVSVAVQPTPATVPDVTGKNADLAEEALTATLYQPLRVDLYNTSDPAGTVTRQYPAPGTLWTTGRPVAFVVAAGPDDGTGVEVPDVVGKRLEAALADVHAVGLVPYAVVRDVNEPESNEVVAQFPEGGAVIQPGDAVLVYLELP